MLQKPKMLLKNSGQRANANLLGRKDAIRRVISDCLADAGHLLSPPERVGGSPKSFSTASKFTRTERSTRLRRKQRTLHRPDEGHNYAVQHAYLSILLNLRLHCGSDRLRGGYQHSSAFRAGPDSRCVRKRCKCLNDLCSAVKGTLVRETRLPTGMFGDADRLPESQFP
jgi:hypothetical protein